MKKLLVVIVSLFSVAAAQATSLNPCTPTVHAVSSHLSCVQDGFIYSITIHTLMSPPIAQCRGANHFEIHSAVVAQVNKQDETVDSWNVYNGEFTYELGMPGMDDGSFDSAKIGLSLRNCSSPAFVGGASFGN